MSVRFVLCVIAAVLTASMARAQLAEPRKTCTGDDSVAWALQITSCTVIVESKEATAADRARAYRNRGIAKLELTYGRGEIHAELESAIADFDMALALDRNDATAYLHRGIASYYVGSVPAAIADYTEALRIDPSLSEAYQQRAQAHLFLGQEENAVADYTEMLRINPSNAQAYAARAYAYTILVEHQRAIADYGDAIRLDPKSSGNYADRGRIFSVIGELDRALADFTEAIKLEPTSGDHHVYRGYVHFYRGDFTAAAKDFDRAVVLGPSGIQSLFAPLFRYLARQRAGEDGSSELADTVATWKDKVPMVELFLGRGSREAVVAAMFTPSDRCETEFYLGEWHLIRGERDAARQHLQAAMAKSCRRSSPHYLAAAAELKRMGP